MRPAKMKSFRLNRILSRMFQQSFEEILEPSVVVVVIHRFTYVKIRLQHKGVVITLAHSLICIAFTI